MQLEQIVTQYGYLAILVGVFLEGETILVIGGFLAHRGYLSLIWVIAAAFVGSLVSDQLYFHLARHRRSIFTRKLSTNHAAVDRANRMIEAHRWRFILGFRFIYGIRTLSPIILGLSSVPTRLFVMLNALGAALWAPFIALLGYFFGHSIKVLIKDVKRYELAAIVILAALGVALWLVTFLRGRNRPSSRETDMQK